MNYCECYNQVTSKYICFFAMTILANILLIILANLLLKKAIYIVRENDLPCILKEKIFYFAIIAIACVTLFLLLMMTQIIAAIKDIPHLKNGDCSSIIGIVVSQDAAGREDVPEDRTFKLKNIESGEIVELRVFYTPIKNGDVYEVVYLPHTRCGAVVRKIE